jgi:hypothetical protein
MNLFQNAVFDAYNPYIATCFINNDAIPLTRETETSVCVFIKIPKKTIKSDLSPVKTTQEPDTVIT